MTRTDSIKWLKAIVYIGIYGGLLMPLVFLPKVIFPFVFSKLIFFQIIIGLTFPAYLLLAYVESKYRPRFAPLYIAIVAYFAAMLLSVIFAVDPLRSWWGNQERMNGLFTLLHFFAWLTMMTSLLKTWKDWRRIIIFEIALSVFMGVVSLLQIPFPKLLLFPAGPRVGGLLDNPIYMAAYQIFNLFFIAMIWLRGSSVSMKIFLAFAALIDVGAFIAAQSRGALAGLGAGIIIFAIVYAVLIPQRKAKIAVLSLVALVFVSYGIVFAFRDSPIIKNSPLNRYTELASTSRTRMIAWEIAWKGFLERPLTGWGLDGFHILFNDKYNPESLRFGYYETWFDRAHNTIMDVLSMTGIFGFLTYVGLWSSLYYSVIRAVRRKWIDITLASVFLALPAAYFIQNLFVFDQPAGFVMSYFLFAMICSACVPGFLDNKAGFGDADQIAKDQKNAKEKQASANQGKIPWAAYGVLQVMALIIVWRYSWLPAKASYYSIVSNNYFSAGVMDVSYKYAKQAASIPTPYLDEQTFLQSRNLISFVESGKIKSFPDWLAWHDLVKEVTDKHLKDHPKNTHPHFIYARFLNAFSSLVPEDNALAEKEYLEAVKTSPRRQQVLFSLGRFYLERNKKQEAHDVFRQVVELDDEIGEAHWYAGLTLMIDLGKTEEGAKELITALKVKSPYTIREVREAVIFSSAAAIVDDKEMMIKIIELLPSLPNGSVNLFLEIARNVEKMGLKEQRDLLLGAIIQVDPALNQRLEPLRSGVATSINDALNLTQHLEKNPVAPSTAINNATTSSVVTSSSGQTTGPRLKK